MTYNNGSMSERGTMWESSTSLDESKRFYLITRIDYLISQTLCQPQSASFGSGSGIISPDMISLSNAAEEAV